MEKIVEMKGIRKVFGNNIALDSVDFSCCKGEVLCLLGENGAGKTTLMKILYGMYKKDDGEILYKGDILDITSPRTAISAGIQMVHQHFMLVDTMTVVDNIMIGKEPGKHIYYDRKEAKKIVEELSAEFGLKVPTDKLVKDISIGERQRVEIIKALYQGAELLILDEPTAVLTPQEVEDLFKVIDNLRKSGKTIIIITHKLKEAMAISDRIYVLRQGKMVGERSVEETNIDELSQLMVGHKIYKGEKKSFQSDEKLLKLENVKFNDSQKVEVLKGINFYIRKKEILGIAGVEGNGQTEIINILFGLENNWTGDISIDGKSIKGKKTDELIKDGVSCIHADRQGYSIALNLTVPYNFLMGYQDSEKFTHKKHFVDWERVEQASSEALETYDVRPRDISRKLYEFSGGNQQKFVVGREVMRNPKLLIAAHPTRGVDIMASSFIHKELNRMKENGAGILLISSDLDELIELSDRIAVIYNGQIVEVKPVEQFSLMELGRLMGGGKSDEGEKVING
ncbi:ABC transporter ATP-binding protein [Clostridium sp. Cult3]|uniref:ABC transporter ATP-binding protein n=1 Tax=Clostridium sp. Cult3 TaxID=2079004 RepID=UPI001F450062|nr:ABC transporter ATP-binding protein [Clostridium sp. Cult3]MCF6460164.1 ABC transporter ATP-binding protein [Clostridium sp. Cult3]